MKNEQQLLLRDLEKSATGAWARRILAQLGFAAKMSTVRGGAYDEVIAKAIDFLHRIHEREGVISKSSALQAENMISVLAAPAKEYTILCAAHAHIDMNWMWGFAETVAVTLDTFRTMLNMMKEYPDFTFSQSQASVYRIVEEYDPEMLEEIKARIQEGRWEVTASTWVETDKNMPSGESLARHILYTKKYLCRLLGMDPDSLSLDFEPDTFGHNRNVPEILKNGDVRYYYHCRGYDGHHIYKWRSPSGSSIIAYREPFWYNAAIGADIAVHVPEFCAKHGIKTMLKVYGVGDHGGGPTRRDVETLLDMSAWPVFPTIKFGTFRAFFKILEGIEDHLPVVDQELNFIFTGCYTTQTRIKLANRVGEAKLNEAELYGALAACHAGERYRASQMEDAWRKVLFGHFHDILPGSGIIETREYALGQFQQVLAAANTQISKAFRGIAARIDTSALPFADERITDTISEGAGVGFGIYDYGIPQTERGAGRNRIYHLFNPSMRERSEIAEIVVWDWPGDADRLEVLDANGCPMEYQIMKGRRYQDNEPGQYWDHAYMKLAVNARIPACGYTTCLVREKAAIDPVEPVDLYRVDRLDTFVLENDKLRAAFDPANASVTSLVDKRTGREMLDHKRAAGVFRLIDEDDSKGMTAWNIGRHMNAQTLCKDVKIDSWHIQSNAIRQWISYRMSFGASSLSVVVSLDKGSSRLDFDVNCDWQERACEGKSIPQLSFFLPVAYPCGAYRYDIPFGSIDRAAMDMDVPAGSWALAVPEDNVSAAVMLITRSKYGFRCVNDSLSLTLMRSAYDPDKYPEIGQHSFGFAVRIADDFRDLCALIESAYAYNHPIGFLSGSRHAGSLAAESGFLKLEGGTVAVSAVKMAEESSDGARRMLLRFYEAQGARTRAVFRFARRIRGAWLTDINEKKLGGDQDVRIDGETVSVEVDAHSLAALCIEL